MPLGTSGQIKRYDAALNDYYMDTPGTGGVLDTATADGRYVRKDTPVAQTMAGALTLPADGLTIGTNQIKASGGKVGINRVPVTYALEVTGDIWASGAVRGDGANLTNVNAQSYKGTGTPSATEFGYLAGVTSAIQTQINSKLTATGFASPTASVGLAAVAGSATTVMRSDAAPALSQSISPSWTGTHTFTANQLLAPTIGRAAGQHHTVPAVASDTFALLAAAQALTGKTYNGLTITTSTGTLTVAALKTLTVSNSITFTGTSDGFSVNVPASGTSAMGAATLTVATTNNATVANHAHAITSSSAPGAAASILATDASGYVQVVRAITTTLAVNTTNPGTYQAYINGTMNVASDLILSGATANLYLKDTSTGFSAGTTTVVNLITGAAFRSANFAAGVSGFGISAAGDAEFNNLRARGEIASAVFKINEIAATAGTQGIFYSAAALAQDQALPGALSGSFSFQAKNSDAGGMLFGIGDIVRFKAWTGAGVSDAWVTITARTNNGSTTTYTATLNAGSTSTTLRAGTAAVDYGPSGTGFITLSTDGTVGASPNLTMATHAGSPWSAITTLVRLGNLNGSYGYSSAVHGLGAGQYGTSGQSWITVDQTNGVRIGSNITTRIQLNPNGSGFLASSNIAWDTAGNATIAGWTINSASITSGGITLAASATAASNKIYVGTGAYNNSNTAFYVDGSGQFSLKDKLAWDGSTLAINGSGTFSGTITATAGSVGGWTINSAALSSGGIVLAASATAASNKIYIGVGTYNNSNTAFYVDGSGQFSLKDKLVWDGTSLSITGAINATSGTFSGTITASTINSSTIVSGTFTTGGSDPGTAATFGGTATAGVLPLYALNGSPGIGFNTYLDGTSVPKLGLAGYGARLYLNSSDGGLYFYNAPSGVANAVPSEALRLLITTGGLIGIGGNVSPTHHLDITSSQGTNSSTLQQIRFKVYNTGYTTAAHMGCNFDNLYISQNASYNGSGWVADDNGKASAQIRLITANGAGQIHFNVSNSNGVPDPAMRMYLDGTGTLRLTAYGAGSLSTDASGNLIVSSDPRLKDILRPFNGGLILIRQIQPISFTWKATSGYDSRFINIGFNAAEVQAALPDAVGRNENGMLTLSDRALLAVSFNALREVDVRMASYDNQLGALQQRVATLEATLAAILKKTPSLLPK